MKVETNDLIVVGLIVILALAIVLMRESAKEIVLTLGGALAGSLGTAAMLKKNGTPPPPG